MLYSYQLLMELQQDMTNLEYNNYKQAGWKYVWENRQINKEYDDLLTKLIRLDGFDRSGSIISKEDWLDYCSLIAKKCDIENTDSIFEVGCGAGALLYPFYVAGYKIAGLDYSQSLIRNASAMWAKNQQVFCEEAINLSNQPRYDVVISNSTFFYFPHYEYAYNVLMKMIQKANKTIAVLEIPNKALFEQSENVRKETVGEQEYKKAYSGLQHLYYEKDWFRAIANKNNLNCEIFNQNIKNYINSPFRFNCIFRKK